LYEQLESDEAETLLDARIGGLAFLDENSDYDFYRKIGLSPGTSQTIVALARNVGKKSTPFYFMNATQTASL
jgi:hypothetical protein